MTNAWRASDQMMRLHLEQDSIGRARLLRRDVTPQERKLWRGLREAFPHAHFRRQVPLGRYIADFAWHAARLTIEVDGGQHGSDAGLAYDAHRTNFLEGEGYRVLRFWNCEIDDNLDGVLTVIASNLPPPCGEGGVGARRVRAAGDSPAPDTTAFDGAQTRAAPTLNPPHKGEGIEGQPSVGVY